MMDFKEIEPMVKLERLFPLYRHAVKEIFHEHTRVNGVRFRDAIILLGQNESTKHEIQMFAKEVNQKVIKVNSPTHVTHFAQLLAVIDGESKAAPKKVVKEPVKSNPRRKKVDSDEDVDDKVVVKKPVKKVDPDEDIDDKPKKKEPVKKAVKKAKTPSPSLSEEEFSSSPASSEESDKKVSRRKRVSDEDELEL